MPRTEAVEAFASIGEEYKVQIIEELPEGEQISVYRQGDWMDLCRGPHVPDTGKLKAFKLIKVAGAYWRGDENRQMLQRIYGTAWFNKKDLAAFLERLEEAKRRDHRVLGKELDLFSIQEEVGPGMVLWHPNGGILRYIIEESRIEVERNGMGRRARQRLVKG